MAVRTIRPVSFVNGDAYVEYDYEDSTGEILSIRGVNNGEGDLYVRIFGTEDSGPQARNANYERTFAAGSGTTEWKLNPGQRKRFTLVPDGGEPGRPDYYPTLGGLALEASY